MYQYPVSRRLISGDLSWREVVLLVPLIAAHSLYRDSARSADHPHERHDQPVDHDRATLLIGTDVTGTGGPVSDPAPQRFQSTFPPSDWGAVLPELILGGGVLAPASGRRVSCKERKIEITTAVAIVAVLAALGAAANLWYHQDSSALYGTVTATSSRCSSITSF